MTSNGPGDIPGFDNAQYRHDMGYDQAEELKEDDPDTEDDIPETEED